MSIKKRRNIKKNKKEAKSLEKNKTTHSFASIYCHHIALYESETNGRFAKKSKCLILDNLLYSISLLVFLFVVLF